MKNLLLIAVILLSGLSILAQETTIDKAEFDQVMIGSYGALANQPYRTIEESEMQGIGPTMKNKIVREQFMGNSRVIFESDSSVSYMKTETIFVNGKRYKKTLNNPWVEETTEVKTPAPNKYETISSETIYKSLGESFLNDKKVKAYKTNEIKNLVNKEQGNESVWNTTTTYWFAESGLLVKKERVFELTIKPKQKEGDTMIRKEAKSVTKSITITEIDQNIKIEAPQIG